MKLHCGICFIFVHVLLAIKASLNRYCLEAVHSVKYVTSCPISKSEWDAAAKKKNCSRMALHQNCSTVEKFQYHCVINEYRNKMVEVCAPSRIIFGNCVEFNVLGGVIQDQHFSPCRDIFPKCDNHYDSSTAYKYPDCYKLVSGIIYSTTDKLSASITTTMKYDDTLSRDLPIIFGIVCGVLLTLTSVCVFFIRKRYKKLSEI